MTKDTNKTPNMPEFIKPHGFKKTLRMCSFCRNKFEKGDLIKITKDHKTGNFVLNPSKNVFGRSFYVCKNENCIKGLLKKKKLEKIMKTEVDIEKIKVQLLNLAEKSAVI